MSWTILPASLLVLTCGCNSGPKLPDLGASPAPVEDGIIAKGPGGALSRASALTFRQAVVFSLDHVGAGQVLAGVSEERFVAELARAYPAADLETQRLLAHADEIWPKVRASWTSLTLDEQRAFVHGVLEIAMGAEGAARLTGVRGGSGTRHASGGARPDVTVDDPGTSCWASAGCESYDSTSGYTFAEPSVD